MPVLKICGVGIFVLALSGCGAPRPRQAAPSAAQGSVSSLGIPQTGKLYRVDENRSELRVLVYRAGALARLGHNHVMVNRAVRGSVSLADAAVAQDAAGTSSFSLSVPVAGFVVDDAQARREEGSDFAAEVPDDARTGTLHNMQSSAVLDSEEFPMISINGVNVAVPQGIRDPTQLTAAVTFSVVGHESIIDVPFALQIDSGHMVATGTLELRQTALGLRPYSLMLGALQVQDAMTIKFKIVASL